MRLRLKFRHQIGSLVVLAALGLITVATVTLVLGQRGAQQLAGIETRYVPLIELDRDLQALFVQIPHTLEDAATADEESGLRAADALYDAMVERLRVGRRTIVDNGGDPYALEAALSVYYEGTRHLAAALMAGTSAAQLSTEIEGMRLAHQSFAAHLNAAITPDRQRLAAAFATARASQRAAIWIDFIVASSALVMIALLSRRIIRYTVSSLQAVTGGVERLARGDFSHEIDATTRDELGDLAREANQTAARLREYHAQLSNANATLEARNATLVSAQQLLEERAAELARASQYKSEFLANMSHELRTPLNSILLFSQILADNEDHRLSGKQVELATLIHHSGEELLAQINEVLDLAKVESGKQVLTYAPLRLIDLLDYARRMFQPLATQKRLRFVVEGADDLPATIRTDWSRLAQILKNLIANAFKFTQRGSVVVRVARPATGVAQRADGVAIADPLLISVADTGIGIAVDKQAWIFEAFAQAETGTSRKFGGTGLGLAIARHLAVLLGGDLTVASALGEGSTFSLVLPIEEPAGAELAAPRPAGAASAALPRIPEDRRPATASLPPYLLGLESPTHADDPRLAGRTVMVVDDDMRNLYSLSSALRGKRLRVVTATDAQEALDQLARGPEIEAVMIGGAMSLDDHDVTRRIRAQDRLRALAIIALTASSEPEDRERCLAAGASASIARPIVFDQLLALLRTWLV